MKVLPRQADATEAIRATRAGYALDQVRARCAAFAFNAMLARNQRLTLSTMRTIRTTEGSNAIVAANKALRVRAKCAVAAALTTRAGHAAYVGRTLSLLAN